MGKTTLALPMQVVEVGNDGSAIRPAVALLDAHGQHVAEVTVGHTLAERKEYARALCDVLNGNPYA